MGANFGEWVLSPRCKRGLEQQILVSGFVFFSVGCGGFEPTSPRLQRGLEHLQSNNVIIV